MNKIIIILIIALALALGFYSYFNRDNITNNVTEPSLVTPTPSVSQINNADPKEIFDSPNHSGEYKINTLLIRDINSINLISNLKDRLTSTEAMVKNNCTDLVSAGFYTKELQHIGLFIAEYQTISNNSNNIASSAYFYIDDDNTPQISDSPPSRAKLAIQSYPYLYNNRSKINVITNNEEYSRRIAVATTTKNEVMFMIFYTQGSVFNGPRLDELPGLIEKFQERESVKFKDVLNLDGGRHSAMISRIVNIPELSTIGGYFCIRY